MKERPIEHCYWVVPGKPVGEYPRNKDEASSRAKMDGLLHAGVAVSVDLTMEDEGLLPYDHLLSDGVPHLRFPIKDVSVPRSPREMVAILDAIDDHLRQGRLVYLHCWGGIGRTGTIVGCWLSRQGVQGTAALGRLQQLWQECPKSAHRKSPETHEQEQYTVHWEEDR